MSVDLQTLLDALQHRGIHRLHFGRVELYVHEPRAQQPFIHLEIADIESDEDGSIKVLLKERLPS